jgi:hypothetical protein
VFGDFEALDRPITQVAVPAKEIPNDQLGNYLAKVALIQEWCRAVLARGEAEMLSGNKVTGWKVVAGKRGNRAWSDATEAETVLKSFRLKREQMYDFSLISPTSAEKVLKAKPKRWAKVLPLITQSAGNPSVVPETDKRPAIEITPPANDFANLEEELL